MLRGITAEFTEVHVWRLRDGRAIEFREYQVTSAGGSLLVLNGARPAVV